MRNSPATVGPIVSRDAVKKCQVLGTLMKNKPAIVLNAWINAVCKERRQMANTLLYERVSIVWESENDKCPCLFKGEELKLKGEQTRGSIGAVIDRNDICIYCLFKKKKKKKRRKKKKIKMIKVKVQGF